MHLQDIDCSALILDDITVQQHLVSTQLPFLRIAKAKGREAPSEPMAIHIWHAQLCLNACAWPNAIL